MSSFSRISLRSCAAQAVGAVGCQRGQRRIGVGAAACRAVLFDQGFGFIGVAAVMHEDAGPGGGRRRQRRGAAVPYRATRR